MNTQSEIIAEIREYFEQRADAEYYTDRAGPVPNEEMRMLAKLDELQARPESAEAVANWWKPEQCPITKLPFFMWITHPDKGWVPTYGGPYDSYTLPEFDGKSYIRERFDHDEGTWLLGEVEDLGVQIVDDQLYVTEEYPSTTPPTTGAGGVPEWMAEISQNLKTQDNRITQDPLFVVFQKREIVVDEDYDHDRIAWGNSDGEANDEVQERLNELYDDLDSDFFRSDDITLTDEHGTAEWRRVALKGIDDFVTACFTEVGANDYLKANGHNLCRPYIFVTSLYRNEEMKRLREWLLSTTPGNGEWVRVPEGWKLVPIASTSDMDIAGMELGDGDIHPILDRVDAEQIWNAMIAVSPQPPVQGGE